MIQLTQGLRTDTPSSFLQIVNDNFTIVQDNINNTNSLLNSDTKTLTGLNSLSTSGLSVSSILTVNNSQFVINNPGSTISLTGDININGQVIRGKVKQTLDSSSVSIGSTGVTPDSYCYLVSSSTVGGNVVSLYPAINYQEILIVMTTSISGTESFVTINAGGTANIAFKSGATSIKLSAIGQTVSLKYIDGTYYIIGGNEYTQV